MGKTDLLQKMHERALIKHLRMVCSRMDQVMKRVAHGKLIRKVVRGQRVGIGEILVNDQPQVWHHDAQHPARPQHTQTVLGNAHDSTQVKCSEVCDE